LSSGGPDVLYKNIKIYMISNSNYYTRKDRSTLGSSPSELVRPYLCHVLVDEAAVGRVAPVHPWLLVEHALLLELEVALENGPCIPK
jgi:hypothetical protein